MSNKITTQALSGYMELMPREQRLFSQMLNTIRKVYEENGFIAMDQPLIDRTESLLANVGGDTTKELVRIARDDDKELALRFDLTVPLARFVANNYGELVFPFRRYAIGKVYRGERPQAGRFREFYQCDVDIIGNEQLSLGYDADIIVLMARVLERLNIGDFEIRINNRKILNGMLSMFTKDDKEETTQGILRLIDKINKISKKDFEIEALNYVDAEFIPAIHTIINPDFDKHNFQNALSILEQAINNRITEQENLIDNSLEITRQGIDELKKIGEILSNSPFDANIFKFDPSIARGLDYYTGTVFETRLVNNPEVGSVCSGGRYDNLTSAYTTRSLPGVGTSIGLTRLFDQLLKKGVITPPEAQTNSQVLIVPLENNYQSSLALQDKLLSAGIACEISYTEGKLDKRLGYANKLGIPFVALIGSEEEANNKVTLKNMSQGSQETMAPEEVARYLQEQLPL